jgi:hypothetical protein
MGLNGFESDRLNPNCVTAITDVLGFVSLKFSEVTVPIILLAAFDKLVIFV